MWGRLTACADLSNRLPRPSTTVARSGRAMTAGEARLRIKTWICASIVVLSQVFGNFFLKRGMPSDLPTPISYITALFQPWAALGVALLVLWLISRMAMLSWADLSYVLPVTSIGYVLVALMGTAFLHERIGIKRWSGILLIVAGVALVSAATPPQTETPHEMDVHRHYRAGDHRRRSDAGQGMRRHGEIHDFRPNALGRAAATLARNRFVVASVVAMAVSFFAYMALLTVAELSFAVPVTAVTYVLETILAKYVLKEQVTALRWAGASLVICGVALVSL